MNPPASNVLFVSAPSGEGKSFLETMLRAQCVSFIASPVHTDGPEDFAQAERAAHDIDKCLPTFHDTVLEATDRSLSDDQLRELLKRLPDDIREQIADWGLGDTEVNVQVFAYLQHNPL